MSSITWNGDNLVQKVGDNTAELGNVKFEESSNRYILWLKDVRGVFGTKDAYVRGDTFSSMDEAKKKARSSTSAWLFHLMWLVYLRDNDLVPKADIEKAAFNIEHDRAKPVTESYLMKAMKKSERMDWLRFFFGIVIGLIVGVFL